MSNLWRIEIAETDIQERKNHQVHLLVKAKPQVAPYEIIHKLWKQHRDYLLRFFWNGAHNLWTRGYFCSTIGKVSDRKLKEHVEKQG